MMNYQTCLFNRLIYLQMDTTLSTIMVLPSNNDEITRFVNTLRNEILDGGEDPLKVLKQIKMIEKTLEILLKDVKLRDFFEREAWKYGKSFDHLGTHFDIREAGVKYNYAVSGDSVWVELDKAAEEAIAKRKAREKFLVAIPDEGTANPETGEILRKPLKTSTTVVAVRLQPQHNEQDI